jgi:hypothetical protein
MGSILYEYFFSKIIILFLGIILITSYKRRKINKSVFILVGIFLLSFIYLELNQPSFTSNAKLYNKFMSLKSENVKNIKLFNNNTLKLKIDNKVEIDNFLNKLKKNKFNLANHPNYINEYILEITDLTNKKINFNIIETKKNGVQVEFLNEYNKKLKRMATYRNDGLLKYLDF